MTVHAYEANASGEAFSAGCPTNPFILMEIVMGKTLEELIRHEDSSYTNRQGMKLFALTPERLSIAVHVAEALRYLHQKKLVHRDVKPANIFLPSGGAKGLLPRAKLGDFGIMKWGDFQASVSSGTLTMTSQHLLIRLFQQSPIGWGGGVERSTA